MRAGLVTTPLRSYLAALAVAAGLASAAPAAAQVRDPLGGQFGAVEVALPPRAALRDAELLGAQLSAIKPQRPGVVDTYVLSMSLWNDPVFEREATEAGKVLAQRFDAEGRMLVLSAGTGSGERKLPAASPDNINAAIGKLGASIDPQEDLVVVFLTTHGGPDGTAAIQEKNRLGGGVKPAHLRNSLNAAGIRNRVVIVSACFSGHFILPFSDAFTAVFTAAAADRSSFGCQPENDWTYFGDALFNRSLRGGLGLEASFDASLKTIAKWEDDLVRAWNAKPAAQKAREPEPVPSNPQKHVGDAIAPILAKAERYGVAVQCAGQATYALKEINAGKALDNVPEASALQNLKADFETRAAQFAMLAKRTPDETAKAIAAATKSATDAGATGCLTKAG